MFGGRGPGGFDLKKARSVSHVLDVAPMREEMRQFLEKTATYTLTSMTAMLRLATRAPGLMNPPGMRKVYLRGTGQPPRETDARRRVIAALDEYGGLSFTLKELAEAAAVTPSVIKAMLPSGAVIEADSPRDLPYPRLNATAPGKELTGPQTEAATALRDAVSAEAYSTTLLKGVTGSGKTEVYLEAVAACLAKGRQALVLLPEIALTSEFLTRFETRFGRASGGMAFGGHHDRTPPCVAHGGTRRGTSRDRRALCVVFAVSKSWTDCGR